MKSFLNKILCFLNIHHWSYYKSSIITDKNTTNVDIEHKKCKHCNKTMYRDLMPYSGYESKHWHLGNVGKISEKEKKKNKRKNIINKVLKNG